MLITEINSYLIIIIYGSLLLLSFLLISNPLQVNKKANFWFGIFTILWSTFWFEELFILTGIKLPADFILIAIREIQFFTPLVFYFSVVYYTNPDFSLKKTDFKYLLAPLLFIIGLITFQANKDSLLLVKLLNAFMILHALSFIILAFIAIKQLKKKIHLFASNTSKIDLKWLEYIIIALLGLSLFMGLYNVFFTGAYLNVFANCISLIIIFFISFNSIKQKEIFLLNSDQRKLVIKTNEETTSEKKKIITDKDLKDLKSKLVTVMQEQKPYLDYELNLVKLAELIKITPHQLSYVINKGFNENFFMFVNKYRIEIVKVSLLNTDKKNLSIMGIAYESGFNSKTAFNTTFKKITDQTPSEFKKNNTTL